VVCARCASEFLTLPHKHTTTHAHTPSPCFVVAIARMGVVDAPYTVARIADACVALSAQVSRLRARAVTRAASQAPRCRVVTAARCSARVEAPGCLVAAAAGTVDRTVPARVTCAAMSCLVAFRAVV
jgi:hypothetical protein